MSAEELNLERLSDAGTEVERWLLSSRDLDEPDARLVKQTVAAVLAHRRRARFAQAIAAGGALALAATVLFWFAQRAATDPQESVTAERVTPSMPSRDEQAGALPDPCSKAIVARGNSPLIDDLEDRNGRLSSTEGRTGSWFVENDRTGTQEPAPGQTWHPITIDGARHALRTRGGVFKDWGAAAGFHFAEGRCYDASAYDGIEFVAKGSSRVSVTAQMIDVVPVDVGGTCEKDCFGNHLKTIELRSRWQRYVVRWAEFQQPGFGKNVDFDPKRLRSILFSIAAVDTPFDLWIDEVSFLER